MEAARFAPNHKRTEPWKFYLLGKRSEQSIRNLVYATTLEATTSKGYPYKTKKKKIRQY